MKMFRKNLCDKVSRMKNLRLLSSSFFHADRRGVLHFLFGRIFHGENHETKSPVLSFFKKKRKAMKMFRKNLCDKVSKIKNLRWLSSSFFRAVRRGILRFFGRRIFHGENRETKSSVFTFFEKSQKCASSTGRNGGQKSRNAFFCRIHLRERFEPVVLHPPTFSVGPRKGV